MGIIQRQGFWSTIFNYLGVAIGFVNMIWLYPNALSEDNFGLLRVVLASSLMIARVLELGLTNTATNFLSRFNYNDNHYNGFISFLYILPILAFILFIALNWMASILDLFTPSINIANKQVIMLIIIFSSLFGEITIAILRSIYINIVPIFIREIFLRVLQLSLILVYKEFGISFQLFVLLFSFTYLIHALLLISFANMQSKFAFSRRIDLAKKVPLRKIADYSLFMLLNRFPSIALNQIDIIMLGSLAGLREAGFYFVAYSLADMIRIPYRNIIQISTPLIAASWHTNDISSINKLYKQSANNLFLIGSLILLVIYANFYLLAHLFNPSYTDLIGIVVIIALSKLFDVGTGLNATILQTSSLYRYVLYLNLILTAITIILNLLLIPEFGIMGAAIATAVSVLLVNSFKVIILNRSFNLTPFSIFYLRSIIFISILTATIYLLPDLENIWINSLYKTAIIILFSVLGISFFSISPELKELLRQKLSRLSG